MEKAPSNIPQTCGVYTFWQAGKPIYIGKAVNLKSRISSYFSIRLLPKTKRMVADSDKITVRKVLSEFEALLLESRLIRTYMPKYNTVSKDDKNPLYITITKEEYPRVITTRGKGDFGPFPSSSTVKEVLKMIRRIFPYSDHKVGKRPCIYSQIGLCRPCPSQIKSQAEKKEYLNNISNIKRLLSGRILGVKADLEKRMKAASLNDNFEDAAEMRNKINRLEYITKPRNAVESYLQNPNLTEDIRSKELRELRTLLKKYNTYVEKLKRIECYDIAHLSGSNPAASMVVFTNGEADKSQYRHFKIRQKKGQSDYDSIREVAKRRKRQSWTKPDLIIVDGGLGQVKSFQSDYPVIGIAKNPDRLIIGKNKVKPPVLVLSLIQRIRDEAHRFARRYHHRLLSIYLTHENHS